MFLSHVIRISSRSQRKILWLLLFIWILGIVTYQFLVPYSKSTPKRVTVLRQDGREMIDCFNFNWRAELRRDTATKIASGLSGSNGDCTDNIGQRKPHIIFMLADDLGWAGVGYNSGDNATPNKKYQTPNIDALAGEGVKLQNYYVHPICTPSRVALMTGKYTIHTGNQHNVFVPNMPISMPRHMPTMADTLRHLGYTTHMLGKWHLGHYNESVCPWNRGFDTFYGFLSGGLEYSSHRRYVYYGSSAFPAYDFWDGNKIDKSAIGEFSTKLFTERATKLIREHNSEKPFFLYLSYQAVHAPIESDPSAADVYADDPTFNVYQKRYGSMTTGMDLSVGKVIQELKSKGMWNNTILIFSTDNGGEKTFFDRNNTLNYPLKGHKRTVWEGGVRGVGFVAGPLLKKSQSERWQLMHISDWYPTLARLAGGIPEKLGLDGKDIWGSISCDEPIDNREVLLGMDPLLPAIGPKKYYSKFDHRYHGAIRWKEWKLITGIPYCTDNFNADTRKLYFSKNVSEVQNLLLYNIRDDPTERNNVAASNPAIVCHLLDRLAFYNSTSIPAVYPAKVHPHDMPLGKYIQPWREYIDYWNA